MDRWMKLLVCLGCVMNCWVLDIVLFHGHDIFARMIMFVKETAFSCNCIHVHVYFMKTEFSCDNGFWVRVYHDPKPRWGIISVELLWSLRSGIY
jgi:hypothetical protein